MNSFVRKLTLIQLGFMLGISTAVANPVPSPSTPLVLAPEATYKVRESGESLSLVALRLYGKSSKWKSIAELNGLKAPYRLKISQVLRLPIAPTLTKAQGDQKILAYWRKHFGLGEEKAPVIVRKAVTAPETPIDDEFVESGKPLLVDRKLEKAFEYFSPLSHVALSKAPKDDEIVYLDGAPAERIYKTLGSGRRKPASTPKELTKIAPTMLRFEDYESKRGTDIVCAKVPLVDVNRKYVFSHEGSLVFNFRCVGIKK